MASKAAERQSVKIPVSGSAFVNVYDRDLAAMRALVNTDAGRFLPIDGKHNDQLIHFSIRVLQAIAGAQPKAQKC